MQNQKSDLFNTLKDLSPDLVKQVSEAIPEPEGFASLPPKLNGIAQLKECKFRKIEKGTKMAGDKDKWAGQYYFYAVAIVVEPFDAQEYDINEKPTRMVRVAGKRTSIIEALHDTNTDPSKPRPDRTKQGHYESICTTLKKLWGEGNWKPEDFHPSNLERTAAHLEKLKPYFRFRTWRPPATVIQRNQAGFWVGSKGAPFPGPAWKGPFGTEESARASQNGKYADQLPKSQEFWQDREDPYTPPMPVGMKDQSTQPKASGSLPPSSPPTPPSIVTTGSPDGPLPRELGSVVGSKSGMADEWDLPTAAARADAGDEEAKAYVLEVAVKAGWSPDEVASASTFQEIADAILGPSSPADNGTPKKGNHYLYRPINPRTKKPGKPVQVEVLDLNTSTKTAHLRDLASKTEFADQPWAMLEELPK